jgi:hypothetical protein
LRTKELVVDIIGARPFHLFILLYEHNAEVEVPWTYNVKMERFFELNQIDAAFAASIEVVMANIAALWTFHAVFPCAAMHLTCTTLRAPLQKYLEGFWSHLPYKNNRFFLAKPSR